MKAKKPTYAQLARQNAELIAALAVQHNFALSKIDKAANRVASGVMLQLTAVGGADIIPPVMIRDGLSSEAVEALKRDIRRSLDLTKSGV